MTSPLQFWHWRYRTYSELVFLIYFRQSYISLSWLSGALVGVRGFILPMGCQLGPAGRHWHKRNRTLCLLCLCCSVLCCMISLKDKTVCFYDILHNVGKIGACCWSGGWGSRYPAHGLPVGVNWGGRGGNGPFDGSGAEAARRGATYSTLPLKLVLIPILC